MLIAAIFMLLTAVVVLWVCYPPNARQLGRNALAGIRTPTSASSDRAWDLVHTFTWPWAIGAVLLMAWPSAALLVARLSGWSLTEETGAVLVIGGATLGAIVLVIGTVVAGRKAREVMAAESEDPLASQTGGNGTR